MAERKRFLSDYETVQERIVKFYAKYPEGRICTELASDPHNWERCRYKAILFRNFEDERPLAIGHATETIDNDRNFINQAFHEENAESSAIGRALANAGFPAKISRGGRSRSRSDEAGEHPVIQIIWDKAKSVGITSKHMKAFLLQEFGVPSSKALNDVQIAQLAETFERVDSLEEFEVLIKDEMALLN